MLLNDIVPESLPIPKVSPRASCAVVPIISVVVTPPPNTVSVLDNDPVDPIPILLLTVST